MLFFLLLCSLTCLVFGFKARSVLSMSTLTPSSSSIDLDRLGMEILQLGASLDRGQGYNPTSGSQYKKNMNVAREKIEAMIASKGSKPLTIENMDGEWELTISTVPHGIFRSSPFFLAIQDAYNLKNESDKALLFFRLHELQTMSWGVSKIGRVGQYINATSKAFTSEFDTQIFSLTTIPFIGWGKILPTFGGCVITESKIISDEVSNEDGKFEVEVEYTTAKEVEGLQALPGGLGINTKVPVNAIWKLLPWNEGRAPTATLFLKYVDDNFRIVQDVDGEYFVYTRPVVPRL